MSCPYWFHNAIFCYFSPFYPATHCDTIWARVKQTFRLCIENSVCFSSAISYIPLPLFGFILRSFFFLFISALFCCVIWCLFSCFHEYLMFLCVSSDITGRIFVYTIAQSESRVDYNDDKIHKRVSVTMTSP